MYANPLQEDLLDELTRLVGRPEPMVREALTRMIHLAGERLDRETLGLLSVYPMTAWHAIASTTDTVRELWKGALGTGLSAEEVFTALAVVDDHVRRRFGNDAWVRIQQWGPGLLDAAGPIRQPAFPGGWLGSLA